jgi:alkaline phosphatase
MTIGQATTGYDTALEILENQKMSHVEFDKIIDEMIEDDEDVLEFEEILPEITKAFGLKDEFKDSDENKNDSYMALELSDYEVAKLEAALVQTLAEEPVKNEETAELYGGYNPFSVTLTHILNNKAGIGWTSYSHTGVPVPVYATGVNAHLFNGAYDNTEVYDKLVEISRLK